MVLARRRFRRRRGAGGQHHLAAGLLDRGDRRAGRAGDLQGQRRGELALGEEAHPVAEPAQHPGGDQRRAVDRALGGELAGVHRLLQTAEVHHLVVLLEDLVVEAALWQPPVQRGLAALEAVDGDAAARGLALAAAAGRLALARADAAPDPLRAVMRTLVVSDLVELHCFLPIIPSLRAQRSNLVPTTLDPSRLPRRAW